ncbi:MAG: MotA/TolQ/ExbB proton channel family protein [Polyangiaceae bacterium]|nr:MotA/TolQ/ExbB proton channel family protein [Polyangiaceae bacterium]
MRIERIVSSLTGLGASWVLWLLVVLSLVALAVVIERAVFFSSSRDDVDKLRAEVLKRLKAGEVKLALRRLEESPCPEAGILRAGLASGQRQELEREAVSERVAAEAERSRLAMEKNLAFLGTVGSNAPFVGLLGTVIGIIRAFHELDASAGKLSSGLMAEIGEALVATAAGLLVALPAIAFFNLFQRLIRARLGRAEALSRDALAELGSRMAPEGAE